MVAATSQTYFPPINAENSLQDVQNFVEAYRAKHGTNPEVRYFLSGVNPGEQVELPPEIYDVLITVLEAMSQGNAVTIRPDSQRITTQQAADLLGVSRPTIVRLIDSGKLPAEKIGRHRRLMLADVVEYQQAHSNAQRDFLTETSRVEEELPSAEFFKDARKAVAAEKHRTEKC